MDWPALFRELVTTYGPAGALAVLAGGALLLPPVRNRIAAALRNGRENGQKATLHHVATLLESHVGETRTEFRLARDRDASIHEKIDRLGDKVGGIDVRVARMEGADEAARAARPGRRKSA